jgi:hypothetical protein
MGIPSKEDGMLKARRHKKTFSGSGVQRVCGKVGEDESR